MINLLKIIDFKSERIKIPMNPKIWNPFVMEIIFLVKVPMDMYMAYNWKSIRIILILVVRNNL